MKRGALFLVSVTSAVILILLFQAGLDDSFVKFRVGGSSPGFPFGVTGRTNLPDGTWVELGFGPHHPNNYNTTVRKGWFGFLFEYDYINRTYTNGDDLCSFGTTQATVTVKIGRFNHSERRGCIADGPDVFALWTVSRTQNNKTSFRFNSTEEVAARFELIYSVPEQDPRYMNSSVIFSLDGGDIERCRVPLRERTANDITLSLDCVLGRLYPGVHEVGVKIEPPVYYCDPPKVDYALVDGYRCLSRQSHFILVEEALS